MAPTAATPTLSRRAAVRLSAGSLVATLAVRGLNPAAAHDATPIATEGERETFVLVHGAWAGAWIWKKVSPVLRTAGHDVYATTATGLGDRVHLADPAINLDVYITDVVNVLEYEDLTNVTLVGHSYGGRIITGVAEKAPERLKQLVYLDGAVPADGETGYLGYTDEGIGFEYRMGVEAGWPGYEVVHAGVEEFVRGLTKNPADAEWVLSKLVPQPMATNSQPIKLGNPAAVTLPRAYVLCTEGKGTAAEDPWVAFVDDLRSDPLWRVVDVADNHLALVNAPEATAEALLSLI